MFVENDASPLYDRILAFAKGAIGAASNVKPIDAGGLASLLPDLLPDAWGVAVADSEESRREGRRVVVGVGAAVAWFPEPTSATSAISAENNLREKARVDHPTYETLAALWRLFVATSPNTLAPFEGWPLLPVDGGERLAPLTPHGALVRGEGWSEHAASAIRALGVSRLHECAASSVAATHTSISLYARAASAAGVLDSAVAHAAATPEAARAARAFKAEDAPTESAPELRWRAAASVVPATFEKNLVLLQNERSADERSAESRDSARRALRAFLMQTRWFASDAPGGAVEGARLDLFRALPVFETADGGFARAVSKFRALAGGSPARSLFVAHTGCSALEASFANDANETNDALLLPPPSNALVDGNVLFFPRAFLRLESEGDGALLESKCLVRRLGVTDTLVEHVLPGLIDGNVSKTLAPRVLDACVTHALDLKASWTGAADLRRLRDAVAGCACVPTRASPNSDNSDNSDNSEHVLRRPGQLFDPRVASLAEVLDAEDRSGGGQFFPRAPFDRGGRIDALVNEFGVNSRLGAEGILAAARAVDAAARDDVVAGDPVRVGAAVRRGAALLAYLDALARGSMANSEALPEIDARVRDSSESESSNETESSTIPFWRALASVAWVPALRAAPETGMPWPSGPRGKPLHALAPPSATRPPRDAWISSSCLRVLDVDAVAAAASGKGKVRETEAGLEEANDEGAADDDDAVLTAALPAAPRDTEVFTVHETLATRLGWDAVAAAAVAAQLLELGGRFPAAGVASFAAALAKDDPDGSGSSKRVAEALTASLPAAYAVLARASRDEMDAAATILAGAPWVWTGAGFAASADVAVFADASVRAESFEPYLYLVPKELSDVRARPLLRAFGVRDRFRASDFKRAAERLAGDAAGEPMGERRVEIAAALADGAADAIADEAERTDRRLPSGSETSSGTVDVNTSHAAASSDHSVCSNGSFMLPDASGIMAPARELTRNDAEWLLGERKGDEGADANAESALRFVHERVSGATAAALGARSLRELYAVDQASTDRLPCPSASVVRAFLNASADDAGFGGAGSAADDIAQRLTHLAVAAAAADVLGIAEAAGADVAAVTLDLTAYPTRSLLQPQLAGVPGARHRVHAEEREKKGRRGRLRVPRPERARGSVRVSAAGEAPPRRVARGGGTRVVREARRRRAPRGRREAVRVRPRERRARGGRTERGERRGRRRYERYEHERYERERYERERER